MTAECVRIRELLDSYRCGELLVETNHAVIAHLRTCAACAGELERRERTTALLREAFRTSADGESDTGSEAERLARRIGAAIDAERRPWMARMRRWRLAAAIVAASALLVWRFASTVPVDAAAYGDAVGDHVACALTYPPAAAFDAARVARRVPAAFAPLVQALRAPGLPYALIDAHRCPYKDRRYIHFVFRRGGEVVSLFVAERRSALPRTGESTRVDGLRVYGLTQPPFRVAATETAAHDLFVVSSASDAGVAEAVLPPSIDHVLGMDRR